MGTFTSTWADCLFLSIVAQVERLATTSRSWKVREELALFIGIFEARNAFSTPFSGIGTAELRLRSSSSYLLNADNGEAGGAMESRALDQRKWLLDGVLLELLCDERREVQDAARGTLSLRFIGNEVPITQALVERFMAMGRRALELSKKKLKQAQREARSSTTGTNGRTADASESNIVENGVIPPDASAHVSGAMEGFAAATKSGGAYANASGGGEQGD